MATLSSLQLALQQAVDSATAVPPKPLTDHQYRDGYQILTRERTAYREISMPQLNALLSRFRGDEQIAVMEIGPGPESVLKGFSMHARGKIKRYTPFEMNDVHASELKARHAQEPAPFDALEIPVEIYKAAFDTGSVEALSINTDGDIPAARYHIVLYCRSMYDINPESVIIQHALDLLFEPPAYASVVVFHRPGRMSVGALVSQHTALFPQRVLQVPDDDDTLDHFAAFVTGLVVNDESVDKDVQAEGRGICRASEHCQQGHDGILLFSAPDIMMMFHRRRMHFSRNSNPGATSLQQREIKNREARVFHPAGVLRPMTIAQVQQCIRWAVNHQLPLTVFGGGHSGSLCIAWCGVRRYEPLQPDTYDT